MGFGNFNFFRAAEVPKEEQKPSEREIWAFNTIQRQLISHYEKEYEKKYGLSIEDENVKRTADLEWIKMYAPDFEKIRKELLQENPHFLEEWSEHPGQITDQIEKEVKIRLYHESDSLSHDSEAAA